MAKFVAVGTEQEVKRFHEVDDHYNMAKQDLETRLSDFDAMDELFRSWIDEDNYPFNSVVFDPRTFTAIFEKTSRLFARKPRGRLVPREGGDVLGARMNNELLSFEWDDNERIAAHPMLAKWAMMDMNARKYGASFALCKWHYERKVGKEGEEKKKLVWYDGPDFKPLSNRDCLPNPAYSTIQNWFQVRDYVTVQELKSVNDAARTEPIYKNLDLLIDRIRKDETTKGGDSRSANYSSRNLSLRGLTDQLGKDNTPEFRIVEIVTEYREDRWITFSPKHGVIIRDIPNPYDHGQIPIVRLAYYPIDDDIYGLSEIEPIERLQKAINALINQYLDAVNMDLYKILKIRGTGVKMHTLKWEPGAKWIMNDPASDVMELNNSPVGISEFTSTYSFMVAAMQNALGETSLGVSNIGDFQEEKTATEVKQLFSQQNARDNFNAIFLSQALKKQMSFWYTMNRQFYFQNEQDRVKVIRIVGKDALRYFQQRGLDKTAVSDEVVELLASPELEGVDIRPEELATPIVPVMTRDGELTKLTMEEGEESGILLLEKEDLQGNYDYIADVETMKIPDEAQTMYAKQQLMEIAKTPEIMMKLQQEGYSLKIKELLEDFFEQVGMKDADKYFERSSTNVQPVQAGAGGDVTGPLGGGVSPQPGVAAGDQAVAASQI